MEADKTFLNILLSPKYNEYKEVIVSVLKKQYAVKIHTENIKSIMNAQSLIRYRMERNYSPHQRGRNKIYPNAESRRKAFIERRRNVLLKTTACPSSRLRFLSQR